MLDAKLARLSRRMQRIGEQQQALYQAWQVGAEHRRLASSVGVPAEEHTSRNQLTKSGDGTLQTFTVVNGVSRPRWTVGPALAIGQIATQHSQARRSESFGQGHQQRSPRVRSRAMSQYQAVSSGRDGSMNESADLRIERSINEGLGAGQHS